MTKRESFPGYPHLMKRAYTERYGRLELIEVNPTSDGYLIGVGKTDSGELVFNLFLGPSRTWRQS